MSFWKIQSWSIISWVSRVKCLFKQEYWKIVPQKNYHLPTPLFSYVTCKGLTKLFPDSTSKHRVVAVCLQSSSIPKPQTWLICWQRTKSCWVHSRLIWADGNTSRGWNLCKRPKRNSNRDQPHMGVRCGEGTIHLVLTNKLLACRWLKDLPNGPTTFKIIPTMCN